MNCPNCGEPLVIEIIDNHDQKIAMATIKCSVCPTVKIDILWPFGHGKGCLVVTPIEVVALG